MAFGRQNLAHFYSQEGGNPGWGQKQRWGLAGATRSRSTYDADFDTANPGGLDMNIHRQISGGFFRSFGRLPLSAPTLSRDARQSAQINTLPNAVFFQGYTGSGTGHNWSGGAVAQGQRMTHQNFNPNQQGAAELHPAMTYDPFPSPSGLYPKVV